MNAEKKMFSTTYYQVTTIDEPGYPSCFFCVTCFDLEREYDRASEIERVDAEKVDEDEIGTCCDMCDAPLASPDADIKATLLNIDVLMAIRERADLR